MSVPQTRDEIVDLIAGLVLLAFICAAFAQLQEMALEPERVKAYVRQGPPGHQEE